MIAAIPKFVMDVGVRTFLGFCKVLWVFHAVMGGTVFIVIGIDGLIDGYWFSIMSLILGAVFFATLIPRFSQRLGSLEKGFALFVVVIVSGQVVANSDEAQQAALLQWLIIVGVAVLTNQVIKQLKEGNT
ncbi:MAG: hypothetical protein AAGI28_14555 [Pseudomonadota bacterium]